MRQLEDTTKLKCDHPNESGTEQYFPHVPVVVFLFLFIMLYKVVLTFESMYEILKCDHSNESYRAVRFCGLFIINVSKEILICESVDQLLKWDPSNESY